MARSGVIYGATGTFKSTACAHLSRWIAETTGKATLLFSADGGGWEAASEEVKAGMILPYRCDPTTIPLPIVRKVSQGYWPANPDEPDISKLNFRPVDWSKIGGIAVEGITSLGTLLMRHCADKGLKTGEDATSKFSQPILVDGQVVYEQFAGNSKAHYGFVQNQLYSLITNFQSLPVSYVLFTAHEKKYADDGELQCGINVPGKAITPLIPAWLGDCIHAQDFRVSQKVRVADASAADGYAIEETFRVRCRYYFVKHPDPTTGAIFDAKPRVTHSGVAALEREYPGGFFTPTTDHGFDDYLRVMERIANDAASADSLKDWRAKADAKRRGEPPPGVGQPVSK